MPEVATPPQDRAETERMQSTFALDQQALYMLEQDEIMDIIERFGDEQWPVEILESEIERVMRF